MATRYASLARCTDLAERDLIAALVSREECAALLGRIAELPSDRSSSRAFVALLTRLGTPACTWLEGELAVELFAEDDGTKVRVMSEIGGGYRERVLPVVVLRQSPDEIVALVESSGALRVERVSARCVLLLGSAGSDEAGLAEFDISESSLGKIAGFTAEDDDVDSGWDEAASA